MFFGSDKNQYPSPLLVVETARATAKREEITQTRSLADQRRRKQDEHHLVAEYVCFKKKMNKRSTISQTKSGQTRLLLRPASLIAANTRNTHRSVRAVQHSVPRWTHASHLTHL